MTTAPALALKHATSTPSSAAIRFHELGVWRPVSWSELSTEFSEIAGGLVSLGLAKGDRVGLSMHNHPTWVAAFLGIQAAGLVVVPVDPDLAQQEAVAVLESAGAVGVICGDQEQFDKVDELQQTGRAASVRFLVVADTRGIRTVEADDRPDRDRLMSVRQLRLRGKGFDAKRACESLETSAPAVWTADGVDTHAEELAHAEKVGSALAITSSDHLLAQTNFANGFERALSVGAMIRHGMAIAVGEGGPLRGAEMAAVQPTVLHAAPGFLDGTAKVLSGRISAAKGLRRFALNKGWNPSTPGTTPRPPARVSPLLLLTAVLMGAVGLWLALTAKSADPMRLLVVGLIAVAAILGAIFQGSAVVTPLRRQLGFSRARAVIGSASPEGTSMLGALGVPLLNPDSITGAVR